MVLFLNLWLLIHFLSTFHFALLVSYLDFVWWFIIREYMNFRKNFRKRFWILLLCQCFASLHDVKFVRVNGDEHELFLAKFCMQNCMMLQSMYFYLASRCPDNAKVLKEFEEKLHSFERRNFVFLKFFVYKGGACVRQEGCHCHVIETSHVQVLKQSLV